MQREVRTLVA